MKTCTECNVVFESSRSFSNHIRWNHKNIEYKRSKCLYCAQNIRVENLNKHLTVCDLSPYNKKHCIHCNSILHSKYKKFCNSSCAASFNNSHKTYGTRRSKIELYFEKLLLKKYPSVEFHFNKKTAIKAELDIFIPSMQLAFEINGIHHYKPVHGSVMLEKRMQRDSQKLQMCAEKDITLHTIDISSIVNFTEKAAEPYLNIITNILDSYV
jgi:hypothetical protein